MQNGKIQAKVFQRRQKSSKDSCQIWITEVFFLSPNEIIDSLWAVFTSWLEIQLIVKLHLFHHCVVYHGPDGVCINAYSRLSLKDYAPAIGTPCHAAHMN